MINMKEKNSLLIVDDDISILAELNHILHADYNIYTAKDGASAIRIAQKSLPDLIVLDVVLPDMIGFDILDILKESNETKDIPVIFITGNKEKNFESEGLIKGIVDYIQKPFDSVVVKHRINNQIKIINLQRDLEHAVKVAKDANQIKSVFLANMSHEIRTPMNVIHGVTEILVQHEKLPFEIEEGLDKIYSSCDLLLGIINDIQDLSKIEANKLDIIHSQYSTASLINDSIHLNIMRINDKPIEFKLQIEENIPSKLIGDVLRIKQILNNLLSNSFKYTDSGKVTLSVACEPLSLRASNEQSYWSPDKKGVTLVFSVQDTGHGMTDEQLRRMFEEYARFSQNNSKIIEGTGLGLAITQHLVQLMDGSIQAKSEYGVGTLFTVRLPQETVDDEVLGENVVKNLREFRKQLVSIRNRRQLVRDIMPYGKVLIVDDVETNLYVSMGLMKLYKLQLDSAMRGKEAIEKIKDGKVYDIIFMDHMMPEMDGMETTKIIRDLGYTAPIIALTANAVAGQAEIFLTNGFDEFISKPIDIRRLDAILIKYIRDKQPPEIIEASKKIAASQQITYNSASTTLSIDSLLLESFVRDARKAVSWLNDKNSLAETDKNVYLNEETLRKYTVVTHGIKSSLLSIRESELSDYAYKLEVTAREFSTNLKAAHLSGKEPKNDASVVKSLEMIMTYTPDFIDCLTALLEKLEAKLIEYHKSMNVE
jgi:signal transduction histidine kinase